MSVSVFLARKCDCGQRAELIVVDCYPRYHAEPENGMRLGDALARQLESPPQSERWHIACFDCGQNARTIFRSIK